MTDLNVVVCVAFDHRAPPSRLRQFKDCVMACPKVVSVLEVSGTFDLIVHAEFASLAAYNEQMEELREDLATLVTRIEANFVARNIRRDEPKCTLWIPCHGGRRRIEASMIDKIIAEGDYMRVHVGDWNSLLHDTIRHLSSKLDPEHFIRLHRSVIVRVDFIDRLLHQGSRWVARLKDGTHQRVAKSHVSDILKLMTIDSSKPEMLSAKSHQSNENIIHVNKLDVH